MPTNARVVSDPALREAFMEEYEVWVACRPVERSAHLEDILARWEISDRESLNYTYKNCSRVSERERRVPANVSPIQESPAEPKRQDAPQTEAGDTRSALVRITDEERAKRRADAARHEADLLRREATDRAELVSSFREALRDYPVLVIDPPDPDPGGRQPRSLILLITDAHVGQLFERERGGNMGEYNLEIFIERTRRLCEKVLQIARDLRAGGPVDKIVVVLGGDLLDGRTIHPGHDHESVGIGLQLRVGPEVFARCLIGPLAANFAEVKVVAFPGNHGRFGRKGELDMVRDSLDLVFVDILELHCRGMQNVTWQPRQTWFSYFTLHGHTYFASHGDNFKAWAGIPFYGAQRNKMNVESMINHTIDCILTGHHHTPAGFWRGYGKVIMNGSFVGASTFGSWLGYGGPPVQKLLLVDDHYACATEFDLILAGVEECLTLEPLAL